MTRRSVLIRAVPASLLLAPAVRAATPFWNRHPPSDWSTDDIAQLLTHSPWAHETNLDFEASEGGHLELPPTGAPGDNVPSNQRGVLRRAPVVVRWESAQPVRDTLQGFGLTGYEDRYAIAVTNVPPDVMSRRRHGDPAPAPDKQQDILGELQGAASLQVPGLEPVGAGIVRRIPGSVNTWLFGFSAELLPLTGAEKEIIFVLHTALVSVKARFEPKTMLYRGKLAV